MAIYVRDKQGEVNPVNIPAIRGKSAYEIAVSHGFVGTEQEWLESLKGGSGDSSGSNNNNLFIDDSTVSIEKTWSSVKTEEFVLNNVGAIWQEINGVQMTIDSTMDGFLREIEILGNTMQNQSELSDIQHLGVWNEEQQGYEIDIITTNQMFVYEQKPVDASPVSDSLIIAPIYNGWNISSKKSGVYQCAAVKLKNLTPGTTYRLKAKAKNHNKTEIDIYMNKDVQGEFKNETTGDINLDRTFTPNQKEVNLYLYITKSNGRGNVDFTDFILVKDKNDVENLDIHKTTLLLPCQLMKIGDISDRLYWDSSKGRYVFEKNINDTGCIDHINTINDGGFPQVNTQRFRVPANNSETINMSGIFAMSPDIQFVTTSDWRKDIPSIQFDDGNTNIRLLRTVANTVEEANVYLNTHPIHYYFISKTPQLIETNITEEIKLPTFMNNTYVYVNGGIQGGIKAKAPVDGGKVIGVLQEENIKLKEIDEIRDELINITMLAMDEVYTMLEPLLADTLSENGSNKIADMYAAMVQRGLKTEDEIPVRYRDEVKKI